jgi:hypothetical protein
MNTTEGVNPHSAARAFNFRQTGGASRAVRRVKRGWRMLAGLAASGSSGASGSFDNRLSQ